MTAGGPYADGCAICDRATGAVEPAGGWVLRDGPWAAGIFDGFEVPGWLFVELQTRHTEGPWSLEPTEAATFGPVLATVAGAVREVTGAERVYWVGFGELFPHFHFLVFPRLPDAPPDERGTALFENSDRLRDPERALETAARIRDRLAAG